MSWRNRDWVYLDSVTHADPSRFMRRQRERIRAAELARKQEAAAQIEAAVKVHNIKQRREG